MNISENNQFKRVLPADKIKILSDLLIYPEEIICKTNSDIFHILPTQLLFDTRLFFNFLDKDRDLLSGTEVICQLIFKKKDLYIFKTTFQKDKFSIYLDLSTDLFQIQRRDNFRLVFPESINSKVTIKTTNGENNLGKVYDLSTTGIRVSCSQAIKNINIDELIDMEIAVTGHPSVKTTAHLRHFNEKVEVVSGKSIPKYYYGFQFNQISHENEKTLSSINMELYRNFISKIGI